MGLNQEMATRLADERMAEWRRLGHAQWRSMLNDRDLRQVVGDEGKRYALDDGDGRVRLVVAVDDGGLSAWRPLCGAEVMRPDGSLVDWLP